MLIRNITLGLFVTVLAISPAHAQNAEERAVEVTRTLLQEANEALVVTHDQAALRAAIGFLEGKDKGTPLPELQETLVGLEQLR